MSRKWRPPHNLGIKGKKQRDSGRQFCMDSFLQRQIALEVYYLGWAYHGFASQTDIQATVEGQLFAALRRTWLIEEGMGWEALGYSRCGRTDKGVSALCQVVALRVRSIARAGDVEPAPCDELDYPALVNRALPGDIRVLGWAPVPTDFSARFSTLHRTYRYFIVQDGSLDVAAMRAAAAALLGEHDFRHFCKVDVSKPASYRRRILEADVLDLQASGPAGASSMLALHLRGTAFLWHQVRCIAAVLLLVGRGLEAPGVIARLLDVQRLPRKPQYCLAPEEPLLLYECAYSALRFMRSANDHARTLAAVRRRLHRQLEGAALLQAAVLKQVKFSAAARI
ncbi:hypothetical protein WJX81_005826 [Elliptochloris bilobata]|uniref:tRNA pseudouridine synthase n=1 Tax=Elliptochloris bilobata TaxID=381761 RepID=A0AAW1QTT9_9CHLO